MSNIGDTDRPASNGRLPDGRFGPGNKASPGNPNALKMHRLRAALLDATTPEEVARVVKSLADKAAAGDVPACKVFLDHVCGRPTQTIEVSTPDVDGDPAVMPPWAQVIYRGFAALP